MKRKFNYYYKQSNSQVLFILIVLLFASCTKKLDVKPNQALIIPSSASEYQRVLNSDFYITLYPVLEELGTDDYYLEDSRYAALSVDDQRIYVWAKELYGVGRTVADWNNAFARIKSINSVLFGLDQLKSGIGSAEYNNVKGSALFIRANINFCLAQVFCKPYRSQSATTDLGIPLLLDLDIVHPPKRVSVAKSYEQIIGDLNAAKELLPENSPYKTRPTKLAVNALLSRVYLAMADYPQALLYADAALKSYSTLVNYNQLSAADSYPLKQFNAETIFYSEINTANNSGAGGAIFFNTTSCAINKELYDSYSVQDLRKSMFFTKQPSGLNTWKGNYTGKLTLFGGLATDELYLTRAECNARKGAIEDAMKDLNTLLQNRTSGTYVAKSAATVKDAVALILAERRKELLFRGLRWIDLRRLATEPDFNMTLKRTVNGVIYTLPPDDPRFVYPIPADEIAVSGMEQNQR